MTDISIMTDRPADYLHAKRSLLFYTEMSLLFQEVNYLGKAGHDLSICTVTPEFVFTYRTQTFSCLTWS